MGISTLWHIKRFFHRRAMRTEGPLTPPVPGRFLAACATLRFFLFHRPINGYHPTPLHRAACKSKMKLSQLGAILLCICGITSTHAFSSVRSAVCARCTLVAPSTRCRSPTPQRDASPLKMMGGVPATESSSSPKGNDGERSPVQESLAGLTVAFSLLSKAIACSAIVGVNPLVGLWSSVVMGITAPLSKFLLKLRLLLLCCISQLLILTPVGARDGVISGTAAVVIVPLSALTQAHGTEYMTLCILVSAIMQG